MLRFSAIVPFILCAIGIFLLSLGIDARKTAHFGIRYTPVAAITHTLPIGYEPTAVGIAALGLGLVLLAAEICRRADQRAAAAAASGVKRPPSFMFAIVPGGMIAFLVWAMVDRWLQT
jgi:hypothetical protein